MMGVDMTGIQCCIAGVGMSGVDWCVLGVIRRVYGAVWLVLDDGTPSVGILDVWCCMTNFDMIGVDITGVRYYMAGIGMLSGVL